MAVNLKAEITGKLAALIRRVPDIVADGIKAMPVEFGAYVGLNMGQENRNPAYPHANNVLYVVTGKLLRAVSVPNSAGYATRVKRDGAKYTLLVGVDESVVPYAMIHEYGGNAGRGGRTVIRARPYIRPAMEEFADNGAGLKPVFDTITRELQRIL